MNNNPLLIIPVETKVRELDAKLLLSLIAASKGMEVVIGGRREVEYLIDVLDKGVYFDKSIAKPKQQWFKRCQNKGYQLVALDEEGLVYFDAQIYKELRVFRPCMEKVGLFFAWGQDQASIMAPELGDLAERVKLTGNPRFDLLTPRFLPLYQEDVEEINDKYGRILLINTNFGFINRPISKKDRQKFFSQFPLYQKRPYFFENWMQEQQKVMDSFVEVLPALRKRYPEHSIVIRPHPSESLEPWEELCSKHQGMYTNREGGVIPWILGSDIVIHWNCTTAIEAFLLGVPATAYRKSCSGQYTQPLPNGVSFHAINEEELFEQIDKAVVQKLVPEEAELVRRKKLVKHHIHSFDGSLASEAIVDYLLPLAQQIDRRRTASEKGIQVMKRIWRVVLDIVITGRQIGDPYSAGKFPDTGIEEIQSKLAKLNTCMSYDGHYSVRKIWKNCFCLTFDR